ncbi:Anaphase-promoting complex subunit 11 [Papilio xuthus]|uniref:Anaphase-promoting complex subunit 11 n=1 Tax=Papilio xuthus TaxID=66420 RepID=A0A194Q084_PAPXU|nr:Anaphase-promoting complex subunit 11 [Papilio xuthus]
MYSPNVAQIKPTIEMTSLKKKRNEFCVMKSITRQMISASWTGVATWRWIANDDNCGICRMPFDSCCPDCKLPGDDCPLVWGACSHCFHIHCIVKWLHSQPQQQCPMCRQDWKFNNKLNICKYYLCSTFKSN